jgi:hypothetical protein
VAVVEVKHQANRLTPESEEEVAKEMDVDRPETQKLSEVQEWLAGLPAAIPADSVDGDGEKRPLCGLVSPSFGHGADSTQLMSMSS